MELLRMIEKLEANLPQIKEELGDQWGEFSKKILLAHNEILSDKEAEGIIILQELLHQYKHLWESPTGSRRPIRVRAITPPSDQIKNKHPEKLLVQHLLEKVVSEMHRLDKKPGEKESAE